MKTNRQFDLSYYRALVLQSRRFGSCYLHAGAPSTYQHDDITFRVTGYGRSLAGGGHKYKAYAMRDGKPVRSTELKNLNPTPVSP